MAGPSPLITRLAKKYGSKYGIRPSVLLGLMEVESGFNPNAVSSAGAQGLTQFMPGTATGYGVKYGDSRKAIKSQIKGAANYLSDLGWADDKKLALSSYNAGPGNPSAAGNYASLVLSAAKDYMGIGGGGKNPAGGGRPGPEFGTKGFKAPPEENLFSILGSFQPEAPEGFERSGATVQQGYDLLARLAQERMQQERAATKGSENNFKLGELGLEGGKSGGKNIKPGGGYSGTKNIALGLAGDLGPITSEKRDTKLTASGNISDHWVGNKNAYAIDIGATGKAGDKIVKKIAKRLGVSPDSLKGTYNSVNYKGFRVQVLWQVEGHYDHVHVGVSAA